MKATLCFLTLILTISFAQSQESVLIQNSNVDAKELEHHLNSTNDSIVLHGKNLIEKVEIYGNGFTKSYSNSTDEFVVPLYDIPLGRHSVAVFTNRKIIMMTLLRKEPYKKLSPEKQTDSISIRTERDTIHIKNIINKKYVVVIEDVLNITYDTIRKSSQITKRVPIKSIPYDISTKNNDYTIIKQSREDYRKHNSRPNGLSYTDTLTNNN